jgi:hypothetical protein
VIGPLALIFSHSPSVTPALLSAAPLASLSRSPLTTLAESATRAQQQLTLITFDVTTDTATLTTEPSTILCRFYYYYC